ncbi:MAG: basic amino acid ABC transporter substrate-binding protein [Syntrophomonadaceae bacterium]
MKKVLKLLLLSMLVLGLVLAAAGCAQKAPNNTGTPPAQPDQAKKPVLTVGSETTYPPMEFTKDGEYVGFDMDLIRAIGEAEGYDVKIQTMGFDSLIPGVNAGNVDCIISSITITEDRAKVIDFSNPYFTAGLIIAVKQDNNAVTTLDDLKGKRLAAEVGTTGLAASNQIKAKDPKTSVKVFDSVGEAFMELEKGGADAVINDMPITAYYIDTTGKGRVKMVGEVFQATDNYGIGVKKGNTALLAKINSGLDKVKASGKYDELYKKWFGEKK